MAFASGKDGVFRVDDLQPKMVGFRLFSKSSMDDFAIIVSRCFWIFDEQVKMKGKKTSFIMN